MTETRTAPEPDNLSVSMLTRAEMRILVLSIDHGDQIVPLKSEEHIPEVMEKKEKHRALVKQMIARRGVDLICEESDPCRLSIAQKYAFDRERGIPWKNISMTAQERLEAGIWEALLYRKFDLDFSNEERPIKIDYRIPEDDVRENFFRDEILKAAEETHAKSVLVLCGDMHTEALKEKLEDAGYYVETNHELTPQKHWKNQDSD